MTVESTTTLRYYDGASDKQYVVTVEGKDGGFIVNTSWGRTGRTLQSAVKTQSPVALEAAQKIADKLLASKRSKGYTDASCGTPYVNTDSAGVDTGIRVQLLNAIDSETELETYLNSPDWGMQEKYDGERRLLIWDGVELIGTNRKGLAVSFNGDLENVVRHRLEVSGKTVIDGEDFGSTFAPFDLLFLNGEDVRHLPYAVRLEKLEALICEALEFPRPHTYRTAASKRLQLAQLREGEFEGVVFKQMSAPYTAGRPNSGGSQFKYKFTESATVRVAFAHIDRRSVAIEMLDKNLGEWQPVGNVTIPANFAIPKALAFAEVRYLYVSQKGGSLFQPVYLGVRHDGDESDCSMEQLKYKPTSVHSQAA